jgi:hypothetical protein
MAEGIFYGLQHWIQAAQFTETPRRLAPLTVYFHMYAGEKPAGLQAVRDSLSYAQAQEITPVFASSYARMAEGFYTARIQEIGTKVWKIENRAELATLRFDHADPLVLDFARSRGVIGMRHFQNSLYVALDDADPAPVVALKEKRQGALSDSREPPYLIDSRWRIRQFRSDANRFSFVALGFGPCEMRWHVPFAGKYEVASQIQSGSGQKTQVQVTTDGLLKLNLMLPTDENVQIQVVRLGSSK